MFQVLKETKSIYLGLVVGVIIMFMEHTLLHNSILSLMSLFVLLGFIIYSAINVAHSAEGLAEIFGSAKGMVILTFSAVSVEVVVIVMMLLSGSNTDIVKDTIFYAIILDVSGIIGLSMYLGGMKHNIQEYNFNSTNYYILAIMFVIFMSMVLPTMLTSSNIVITKDFYYFEIAILLGVGFYLYKQMLGDHQDFFIHGENEDDEKHIQAKNDVAKYGSILFLNIVIIGFLSEILGVFVEPQIQAFGLPVGVAAIIVAIISASPELITAINAAREDKMQIPINIAFGASFATAVFTILVMQSLALFGFFSFNLALSGIQIGFLGLLLLMLIFIFNDNKTHKGEGFFLLVYLALVVFFALKGWI